METNFAEIPGNPCAHTAACELPFCEFSVARHRPPALAAARTNAPPWLCFPPRRRLDGYSCTQFPDEENPRDGIVVSLILVAVALPLKFVVCRLFELSNRPIALADRWLTWESLSIATQAILGDPPWEWGLRRGAAKDNGDAEDDDDDGGGFCCGGGARLPVPVWKRELAKRGEHLQLHEMALWGLAAGLAALARGAWRCLRGGGGSGDLLGGSGVAAAGGYPRTKSGRVRIPLPHSRRSGLEAAGSPPGSPDWRRNAPADRESSGGEKLAVTAAELLVRRAKSGPQRRSSVGSGCYAGDGALLTARSGPRRVSLRREAEQPEAPAAPVRARSTPRAVSAPRHVGRAASGQQHQQQHGEAAPLLLGAGGGAATPRSALAGTPRGGSPASEALHPHAITSPAPADSEFLGLGALQLPRLRLTVPASTPPGGREGKYTPRGGNANTPVTARISASGAAGGARTPRRSVSVAAGEAASALADTAAAAVATVERAVRQSVTGIAVLAGASGGIGGGGRDSMPRVGAIIGPPEVMSPRSGRHMVSPRLRATSGAFSPRSGPRSITGVAAGGGGTPRGAATPRSGAATPRSGAGSTPGGTPARSPFSTAFPSSTSFLGGSGAGGDSEEAEASARDAAFERILRSGRAQAVMRAFSFLLVYLGWAIVVWLIFTYGYLIFQQLGEGAEVSFARDWGIGILIEVRSKPHHRCRRLLASARSFVPCLLALGTNAF